MSYQYHRCTRSCQRVIYINGRWVIICRYGFPKETVATGSLNSITQTLQSRLRGKKIKRLYNLPRNSEERFINDYNSILLLLWEGNIDIQYVGETSMSLDRYITGYITKPEKNATNQLWEECNHNKSLYSRLKSFALKSFKSREIGIYETIDKLLGFGMCEFSEKVEFLVTDQSKDRRRKLKNLSEITKLKDDDQLIFCNNTVDSYYPKRPSDLDKMCLFEFFKLFDYKAKECNKSHKTCFTLKDKFGFLHRRQFPKIVKIISIKCLDDLSKEKYMHQLLILFLPWRNESELKGGYNSYSDSFKNAWDNKIINVQQVMDFEFNRKRSIKAYEIANQIQSEAIQQTNSTDNLSNEDLQITNLGITDLDLQPIDQDNLSKSISQLNPEQKQLFDHVIFEISHQDKHTSNCCQQKLAPIRKFVSGLAGI